MKFPIVMQSVFAWVRRNPRWGALLASSLFIFGVVFLRSARAPAQTFTFYEAKKGDFLVSIVEGGTLQAVNEVVIRNEVEGTSRIIYIVPEGSYVKKGQLLVELDSSSSQDTVNQQQINVEKAQFSLIQARQQLDIQKSIVDSEIQAASLKVEFAQSDVEKYVKGEAEQTRRNAQIQITNLLDSLQIARERLRWSEVLVGKGYETKANLDNDRLKVSQTLLTLEQAETNLWMIEKFDIRKKKRELEATLQEATENLGRVKLQGDRKLSQFGADVESQKKTLELSEIKLTRDRKQLLGTKIHAPQDGLVVYGSAEGGGHFSSESMIEEGAVVRNRQELIKLPDVAEMKLKVKIHESHINQVRLGQKSFVILDSMPDLRFEGIVNKVAPLPDTQARWGNPDLKVYATEILITDELPDVKPGVSAKAEIVITNLANVLSVPLQSVTTRKGKPTVFLAASPPQPVVVTVGLYNSKFIEILTGLKHGDRVLLSPPFDTKDKDLRGAVLSEGEAMPLGSTNKPARPPVQRGEENDDRESRRPENGADKEDNTEGSAGREGHPPEGAGDNPNGAKSLDAGKPRDSGGARTGDDNDRPAQREPKRNAEAAEPVPR